MDHTNCLLIFVKYPDQGMVKSRLAAAIGDAAAAILYEHFVLDLLDKVRQGDYCTTICYDPPQAEARMRAWLGEGNYAPQTGKDLGGRMKNAFAEAFSGGSVNVLLIGSDIPDLSSSVIRKAFLALESHDAVIGPAKDGGYYLIGFKNKTFLPEVFDRIAWGTASVLQETLDIFETSGHTVHMLEPWNDVDTIEDLRSLYLRSKDTDFRNSRTMSYISDHLKEILSIHG